MKALLTILFAVCVTFGTPRNHFLYSIDDVASAMNTGNSSQLSQYFDERVEITLHDKSNSYSSRQAEMIIKNFFTTQGVKTFRIIHKGSNSGSEFCIGNLQTKNGIFRTTIFMKSRTEKQVLQEIRFEGNE
jgi:Tfp pilus assembly protein PilX